MASYLLNRYDRLSKSYFAQYSRLMSTGHAYTLMARVVSYANSAATSIAFAISAVRRTITLGDFTLYSGAVSSIGMELGRLVMVTGFVMERDYRADAVLEFLSEPTWAYMRTT